MAYSPPLAEQEFALQTTSLIAELGMDADLIKAILESAGKFAVGEFAPLNKIGDNVGARWENGLVTMPEGYRTAYQAFVEGGWGSLNGPIAYGGQGLPFCMAMAIAESMGSANMAFALCPVLTNGAIEAIHIHGTEEQRETYLPKLITGEWSGTMNLTEPQAGSDVGALRTMAIPNDDGSYSVKGTKIYISFGDHDLTNNIVHLVLARTPGAPAGTKGISLFLVPKYRANKDDQFDQQNDVRCVSIEHKLGIKASPTCVLSFGDNDDCKGWLVGSEFGGMRAMFTMMNNARLSIGLQGVQIAERATQRSIAFAKERVQGGVAIIEYPDVRRMLLRMKALTQGARSLLYSSAGWADRANRGEVGAKQRVDLLTPLAKAYATDIGCEVASLAIQVHGGMGFIEETGAAQDFRDIRIAQIYEGTNGIQAADFVGRKLIGDGGAALTILIAEVRSNSANESNLMALADAVENVSEWMLKASPEDRLAGSYPFLDMAAVLTCGSLLAAQAKVASSSDEFGAAKIATVRYYLDCLVPEVMGKFAAARGGSQLFYAPGAFAF